VPASVFRMESILVRAMEPETSGNLMENVPPKPQHSSAASISCNVKPRTFASNRRGPSLIFSSRKAWQLS